MIKPHSNRVVIQSIVLVSSCVCIPTSERWERETFFQWCQQQASRVDILPKSLFAKAIQYARNHRIGTGKS